MIKKKINKNRKYLIAINRVTFRWTFVFDKSRKTRWESSIRIPYVRYENTFFYELLTEK